jgi:tetratricopeptide (TPR) repeat protein
MHDDAADETLVSLGTPPGPREPLPLERGDVVGRYVVLEEIGRGAMGVVVAAYDPELDRKIALKLMAVGSRRGDGAGARLLREAQAMARLSHPNVITVHDVGTADGDVFIAMEFVEGGSLRSHLAAKRPRWDEIVRRFIEAGEGLAAAHRQGIVHRDFKPDNVLVRADGRACVGDFGLARRDEAASPTPLDEDMRTTAGGTSSLVDSATLTGAVMGTPAYMAPEQHLRTTVDARSDQFSFCVALWEALCGTRPFAGTTLGTIALNVTTGKREPFPRDSPVPAKIRAALERGLSGLPEQRHASMDELLDLLRAGLPDARDRSGVGAWVALSLVGAGLLAAAWAGVFSARESSEPSGPAPCSRAAEQLGGVWDATQREAASQAFARSSRPWAARSFDRSASQLDVLRDEWIESHTRACEATRVYGEQSEELLDRRMSCLAERRSELAAVGAALVAGSDATIDDVDGLLAIIAPISTCDDVPQLESGLAAPPVEIRDQVEGLRARISELEVARRSTADIDLRERAAKLVAEAEALAHEPVLVEALHVQASIIDGAGQFDEALPIARRTVALAAHCNHRLELAKALALIAMIEGSSRANVELGLWLLDFAAGESARLGDPVLLAVRIESDRAALMTVAGDFPGALVGFERALALAERELGPEHVRAADLRFNIAATHHWMGHYEQAEQGFRAALDVYTKLMGPDHPEVAQCHNNYASALSELGRAEEAQEHAARAVEIWTVTNDRGGLANAYANLGNAAYVLEDYEKALKFARKAHALRLEVFGPEHPATHGALSSIGDHLVALGRLDEAEASYRAALAGFIASVGPEHPMVAGLQKTLAEIEAYRQQR